MDCCTEEEIDFVKINSKGIIYTLGCLVPYFYVLNEPTLQSIHTMSLKNSIRYHLLKHGALGSAVWKAGLNTYHFCKRLPHTVSFSQRRIKNNTLTMRILSDELMNNLGRTGNAHFSGTVLVDAMWDNPNHWLRYTLLRSALGLSHGTEIGIIGHHGSSHVLKTLERFGIHKSIPFHDQDCDEITARNLAKKLLSTTTNPEEILKWNLPHNFPTAIVFDGILKRQIGATVDLKHPLIEDHLTEALLSIYKADQLLKTIEPTLIVLSHTVNFDFGAIAWLAIQKGIPGVVIYGEYGLTRFWRLEKPENIFMTSNFSGRQDLHALPTNKVKALKEVGQEYLKRRSNAESLDVGALLAFKPTAKKTSRQTIHDHFNWQDDRPIVVVYSMSWFDFPHIYGQLSFRDPLDWLEATVQAAIENDHVHWLFRPHPCEKSYGGTTLKNLLPDSMPSHIGLAPDDWNGNDVMESVDALVTLYGTAAIEFSGAGKPVVAASPGWYHQANFSLTTFSREEYERLLASNWWREIDLAEAQHNAALFSCLHFCCPDWHNGYVMEDDFLQEKIYDSMPELMENFKDQLRIEISIIAEWWDSGEIGYHKFKMDKASGYALSNII